MMKPIVDIEPTPLFGFPSGNWHKWFAWYPVISHDHRFIWLRFVSRRRVQLKEHLDGGPQSWWQYSWEKRHV